MTEQPLQRDGFIWEVRRTLDESYTCRRGEDQERISIKSVCPYIHRIVARPTAETAAAPAPAWRYERQIQIDPRDRSFRLQLSEGDFR
jgi:hypothetical protein